MTRSFRYYSLGQSYYCLLIILIHQINQNCLKVNLSEVEQKSNNLELENEISNQFLKRNLQPPASLPLQQYSTHYSNSYNHRQKPSQNIQQVPLSTIRFNDQATINNQPPANIPRVINQDESDRYWLLKNYVKDSGLPLHDINTRLSLNNLQQQQQQVFKDVFEEKENQNQHLKKVDNIQQRIDSPTSSRQDNVMINKKGQVEDVQLFNIDHGAFLPKQQPQTKSAYHFPLNQQHNAGLHHKQIGKLVGNKFLVNCISRSEAKVSICEDHLIKRLNQDAGEGRTVMDVERRVCCALFWHKDCVARMMVETCPDSSPAAADTLMGSRKFDLTLSCQKFNREGCNGSNRNIHINIYTYCFSVITIIIAVLIIK